MRSRFFILLLLILPFACWSRTIPVGRSYAIKSINEAIRQALPGDSVIVHAGIYREGTITVDKTIVLIGNNAPVIDGQGKYEGIAVKANKVVVKGFKVINTGSSSIQDLAGIKLYQVRGCIVRNNQLDNTVFGIYALGASNCKIDGNHIVSYGKIELESGNGIHCWKSDSMEIIGNYISGHRDGIYFEFVTHSIIRRNYSEKNIRYGLHFMFSNNDSYLVNTFKNNGAGVAVMYSYNVKMLYNYFSDNWGDAAYGLLLKEIRDSYIEGNYFERNTSGVYLEGASRIQMKNNTFKGNGWGLKMQANCMDINVAHCNFTGNTFDVSTNGTLVLNKFNGNYWDKYDGYDLDKNKIGDVPYRPVSMYSMIIEKNPPAVILFRSFITALLDKTEKVLPSLTPEDLKDDTPSMIPFIL
jgi:nitrous oxidase accessory protein